MHEFFKEYEKAQLNIDTLIHSLSFFKTFALLLPTSLIHNHFLKAISVICVSYELSKNDKTLRFDLKINLILLKWVILGKMKILQSFQTIHAMWILVILNSYLWNSD